MDTKAKWSNPYFLNTPGCCKKFFANQTKKPDVAYEIVEMNPQEKKSRKIKKRDTKKILTHI